MKTKVLSYLRSAILCFALTFLFSAARFPWGIAPFYMGAYVALFATGGNPIVLSAAYLLARFLSGGVLALIAAGLSAAGVGIVCAISCVTRRRIHPFYAVISAFSAELPTMCFLRGGAIFLFLGNAALSALFALSVLRLVSHGARGRIPSDGPEKAILALAAFALGAGAYGVGYYGITPYYLFLSLLLPFAASLGTGGILPFSFALGATAQSSALLLPVGVALAWIVIVATRGERRIAAVASPLAEGLVWLLCGSPFSPLNFLLMLSGALIAAFLPESLYRQCGARLGRSENSAARAVVNKARLDLGGKLGYLGDALRKMSESLYYLSTDKSEDAAADRLATDLARDLCSGCKGYKDCAAQGGGRTEPLFRETIARTLRNGKATLCDLPSYLNGNCHKVKPLLDGLNEAATIYATERERAAFLSAERERMACEAEGIAGILEVLRKDVRRVVTFDGRRERRVVSELAREGIAAYDAMVTEEDERTEVTVTMEEDRSEDPRAALAVSRAMGVPLIPESVTLIGAGAISVSYGTAPLYDAIVGHAVRVKEGSEACGDTKTVTRLGDRILIALSDGMGSGEEANSGSSAAIALVENFYRTGVDERVVLPLINRLLTMRNDGSFQTLDMCVVDLRTGEADFIKLSAPESVVKRREGSEIVEGGALPLGILREVRPGISRKRLSSGDVVVLATDGVVDAIGADGMVRVLESGRTNNPQTIADNLVRDASYVSAADDQTVLTLRLFRRL